MSQLLEQQLKERNGDARDTAGREGEAALPVLQRYASNEDMGIRALVMECYARIKSDRALAALADGLNDPEFNVQKTALFMLHQVHGAAAVPRLQEKVVRADEGFVRGQSALVLGRIGASSSARVIKARLPQETDAGAAREMGLALARLGDEAAKQKVVASLSSPEARARYAAVGDFEYMNDPLLVARLDPLLSDTRPARNIGVEPYPVMHRVCDRTVEAVAALLPGRLSFKTGPRTYTAAEIEETRRLITGAPPARKP